MRLEHLLRIYAASSPLNGIGLPFLIILSYVQSMMHLLIAVNRFTAFFFPLAHSSLWNNRVVGGTTVVVLTASALLHVAPCYIVPVPGVRYSDGQINGTSDRSCCYNHYTVKAV